VGARFGTVPVVSNAPDFDPIARAHENWENRAVADAMAAATSIMRAQQIVLTTADTALRPLDLTFARYEALKLLAFSRNGSLPLGKMGVRLMVHPTSVTNTIDRLEASGFVERQPHPTDRRTTLACITPAGRLVVEQGTEVLEATEFAMGPLSTAERRQLTALITKLRAGTQ
jgi:DNA-binding MarR family transcriptional regulator